MTTATPFGAQVTFTGAICAPRSRNVRARALPPMKDEHNSQASTESRGVLSNEALVSNHESMRKAREQPPWFDTRAAECKLPRVWGTPACRERHHPEDVQGVSAASAAGLTLVRGTVAKRSHLEIRQGFLAERVTTLHV